MEKTVEGKEKIRIFLENRELTHLGTSTEVRRGGGRAAWEAEVWRGLPYHTEFSLCVLSVGSYRTHEGKEEKNSVRWKLVLDISVFRKKCV